MHRSSQAVLRRPLSQPSQEPSQCGQNILLGSKFRVLLYHIKFCLFCMLGPETSPLKRAGLPIKLKGVKPQLWGEWEEELRLEATQLTPLPLWG